MVVSLAAKITAGAAVLVIGGLVALAAPAIAATATELSAWAIFQPQAEAESMQAAAAPPDDVDEPALEPTATAGLPEGYVYMGDGTWIPAGGPGDCTAAAMISISGSSESTMTARLLHSENLVDMGPREFAEGEVGRSADGRIATYTVAPGDAPYAIGDRFCIYNSLSLLTLNGNDLGTAFSPGRTIVLDPAAVPGFVWDDPYN